MIEINDARVTNGGFAPSFMTASQLIRLEAARLVVGGPPAMDLHADEWPDVVTRTLRLARAIETGEDEAASAEKDGDE